eukprot:GHUV01020538.1.p2 GENE.GHUV01020538.1~~GHUV01020538.1.p2  ORF type:complete len:160 (+),score=32.79 GHUV01020538.1:134-613(+)
MLFVHLAMAAWQSKPGSSSHVDFSNPVEPHQVCCADTASQGPPIFALIFLKGYRPLVFHLPFWTGVAFGIVMQLSTTPGIKDMMNVTGFNIGKGHYASLLGFNVVSTVCCWAVGALALLDNHKGRELVGSVDESSDDGVVDISEGKLPVSSKDNEAAVA